jgi:hypothetical protein
MARYRVLRQHEGDRLYKPGDLREASPCDVAHLVASGVIEVVPDAAAVKAEPAPRNKAERPPRNKAR